MKKKTTRFKGGKTWNQHRRYSQHQWRKLA